MSERHIKYALAGILLGGFALFVWPTVYIYDHMGGSGMPVRINRFTGHAQMLFPSGWQDVKDSSRSTSDNLPPEELAKLTIKPEVTSYGWLKCQVYNGSAWKVERITVNVKIYSAAGLPFTERKYDLTPSTVSGWPNQFSEFIANFGGNLQQGERIEAKAIAAIGSPSP